MVLAHNLKVTGSNPVPATKKQRNNSTLRPASPRGFLHCANDSTPTQQKRAAWGNGGETASLQAIDPADGRRILDRYRQAGVHQMIEEEPNIVTSGKSQRVIIDGHLRTAVRKSTTVAAG